MTVPTNKIRRISVFALEEGGCVGHNAHWERVIDKKTARPPGSSRIEPGRPCADKVIT